MRSSSHPNDNADNQLLSMPNELILEVFCCMSSLSHVVALAATNRRLRHIWSGNVTRVYERVAPRSIPCERDARKFREDQRGSTFECSRVSARDVVHIVRNSQVLEKAVLQFEREIVSRVKASGFLLAEFYGAGARRHPPYLTYTERRRFTRSYYQFWGLMKLDPSALQSRLESMTLKQLFYLCEMSKLTQNIGGEEAVPLPYNPYADANPESDHTIDHRRSRERAGLGARIWDHIERTYRRIHNDDPEDVWGYAKEDGFLSFVVIWDHWHPLLKEVVCCRRATVPSPRPEFERRYIWDDSSDEEV